MTTNNTLALENILGIEGIQRHILSYACFPSLHQMRLNTALMEYVHAEMERRALQVTDAHVEAGLHEGWLRVLLRIAKAGQTIRIASGTYMLGDESVGGHAKDTIYYDTNGEENGGCGEGMNEYDGDCDWNEWEQGYGPLLFTKPGVKLVGPKASEEPVIFFFNATPNWSADSVAFHINAKGVVLENLTIQGHCQAIHVGKEDIGDGYTFVPTGSGFVKHCRIQGSVLVGTGSEAFIQDSVIHEHVALGGRAAVTVCDTATLLLERTSIIDSLDRHPTVPSRMSYPGALEGALNICGRTTMKDVVITNNWPCGIFFAYSKDPEKAKIVVAGSITVANNRGEAQTDHPLVRAGRTPRMFSGNISLSKKAFQSCVESDGTAEGQAGMDQLFQVCL